jgi:2-dehydropantoate 2-reductase
LHVFARWRTCRYREAFDLAAAIYRQMQQPARIVVVGAGAVGAYVGAHIARAGYACSLIDPWPEHVDAINAHGVRFAGAGGAYAVRIPAFHERDIAARAGTGFDVAFVCAKLYDTHRATSLIAPHLAPDGFVVTLQNGLVEDVVADVVGAARTLGCIGSTLSVDLHAPGEIERTRAPGGSRYTVFKVGEIDGAMTRRLESLVAMLGAVDSAAATTNLRGERWAKLVANTMTTGVCALSDWTMRELLADPRVRPLLIRLSAEAVKVGMALGYDIAPIRGLPPQCWTDADDGDAGAAARVDAALRTELERIVGPGISGTAQDLRKGRRTEVDFMNGFVADQGRRIGTPAPAHERVAHWVRDMEQGRARPALDDVLGLA